MTIIISTCCVLRESIPEGEHIRETIKNGANNLFRCHPRYLTPRAHAKLARPEAFENLRIHTDEIQEVISRIAPGTLTVAAVRSLR